MSFDAAAHHRRDQGRGRAAESVALNISEGRARAGLDRADFYRRAAGSANELTTALRMAQARGYITVEDHAAVDIDALVRRRNRSAER